MGNKLENGTPESQISVVCPVMTKDLFSSNSGLRSDQVRGQVERKNLPTIKIGRLNLINLARLAWDTHKQTHIILVCPVMTAEAFAEASGLTPGQVESQLSETNLPRRKVGRLVLVDITELYRRCIAAIEPVE